MELLDPKQIRVDKNIVENAIKIRVHDLSKEEARLANSVSLARENSKKQIGEINNFIEKYRIEIISEKNLLSQEVKKLEEKKIALLQPIYEIREAAEATLADAEKYKIDISNQAEVVFKDREKNQTDKSFNKKVKNILVERESAIITKEEILNKKEIQIGQSAEKQMSDWEKFYKTNDDLNKKIVLNNEKQAQLSTQEKSINNRKIYQDKVAESQASKTRQLKDQYETLARSQERFLKK